jgi:hypothetical protein
MSLGRHTLLDPGEDKGSRTETRADYMEGEGRGKLRRCIRPCSFNPQEAGIGMDSARSWICSPAR